MKALADIPLKEIDRRAVADAARLLRSRFPLDQVILFGSKAMGTDTPESDLDLLLFGAERVDEDGLSIPHPRMHERAFVLAPLLEIAPSIIVPGHGSAADLLRRVGQNGIERLEA